MPPHQHDVAVDDVDTAIDFVIRNGAEDRGQTISYSRVFEAAGQLQASLRLKTCISVVNPSS